MNRIKENKKIIIIAIILIIIYVIVYFFVFQDQKEVSEKEETGLVIVLMPDKVIRNSNNTWYNGTMKDLSTNKFKIYDNNEYKGEYYLTYNNKWYFYDENRNFYDVSNDFIGIGGALSPDEIYSINEVDITNEDKQLIKEYLESRDIDVNIDTITLNKETVNISNTTNTYYIVTNAFLNEVDSNYAFSYILANDNNKIKLIMEMRESKDQINEICLPSIELALDFKNSTYLITNCSYFSLTGNSYRIYNYTNNQYNQVDIKSNS